MKSNVFGRGRAMLLMAVLGTTLLASCGGGQQVETFRANRVIVLGDESSVINADHTKFSVNAVIADGSLDCNSNPLWVQTVAATYGLVFPQCNTVPVTDPVSRIRAFKDAKVADIAGQITAQQAESAFTEKDFVTVLVGANDILAQYRLYTGSNEADLTANVEQAGTILATQVNQITDLGAKVLLSTTIDVGYTPLAITEEAANPGRAALLSRLSARFNAKLRATIENNGRKIGLIKLDEYVSGVAKARAAGGGIFVNTTLPACLPTAALPNCTAKTLGTDAAAVPPPATPTAADAVTWLWADTMHLSAGGQVSLGSLAVTRALNNPF
jgi:outer membrane lipase/esterase